MKLKRLVPILIASLGSFSLAQSSPSSGQGAGSVTHSDSQGQNQSASAPMPASTQQQADDNPPNDTDSAEKRRHGAPVAAHVLRLATPGGQETRNFFVYGASLYQSAGTQGVKGVSEWLDQTSLGLRAGLNRSGRSQEFSLLYGGGVQFNGLFTDRLAGQQATTFFHSLSLVETITAGRWNISLADSTTYTPRAAFGFIGAGPAGQFGSQFGPGIGTTLPVLDPSLAPDQSILDGFTSRISNTSAASVEYRLTGNNTLSGNASYGFTDNINSVLLDERQANFSGDFQHRISRRNTVGVAGGHGFFWYPEVPQFDLREEFGQVSFTHEFSRYWSASIAGGPQIVHSDFAKLDILSSTVSASIAYNRHHNALTIGYGRGTSGGSGILVGSRGDTVTGSFTQTLRRDWQIGLYGGYSRQSALLGPSQTFASEYFGAGVSRKLTDEMGLGLSYSLQRQESVGTVCTLVTCDYLAHRVGLSIDWNPRPLRIR
jgi:hypothetical protein